MLIESYNKIATYLIENFGANFIILIISLTTIASIAYFIVISYIITQMDKRYFIRNKTYVEDPAQPSGPAYVIKSIKIIVGVFLLVCGVLMLVLPGQGLITMLIGLSLLPFPGKNKMEQNLLARKSVRSSLNWIRNKANKDPFIFD